MEANQDQLIQEQIDLYLDGALNQEEKTRFEGRLKEDTQLASEVEKIRIARSIVKNYALREKLKSIHTEEISRRGSNNWLGEYSGNLMKVAASALIIIVSIFVFQLATLNNGDLYSDQFESYQVEVSRGDDQSISDPIVYNYMNGNFQDLINVYEHKPTNTNEANFLAASAYLNLNQPHKASESLEKIIAEAAKGGSSEYLNDAEYYLGLAYLQTKRLDLAHWYFSKIYHDSDHSYHEKVSRFFYWKIKLLKWRENYL